MSILKVVCVLCAFSFASTCLSQDVEFRDKLTQLFEFERSLDGYCVKVDVSHMESAPDGDAFTEVYTAYLGVDRIMNAIRLDVTGVREQLDGQMSFEAYRFLRRDGKSYYSRGDGAAFRMIETESDITNLLRYRPSSPFCVALAGANWTPADIWTTSLFSAGDLFEIDNVVATRYEADRLKGTLLCRSKQIVYDIEFGSSDTEGFGMKRSNSYSVAPFTQLENPGLHQVPHADSLVTWLPLLGGYVPSLASFRYSMGPPGMKRRKETELKYSWLTNVPADIFDPKDIRFEASELSNLQRRFSRPTDPSE